MTKRTIETRTFQFTSKVHRQHSSLVITVPKGLCEKLNISKGDIVLFEVEQGDVAAVMGKINLRGCENERNQRNSNRTDNGGGT